MNDFLLEFQPILQSMPEKLTPEEKSVLGKCVIECAKQVALGTAVASGLTGIVTRRLGGNFQKGLSIGAGVIGGFWRLKSAVNSGNIQLLALEGTRTQLEIATNLMERPNNPKTLQLIAKHFYAEQIYDDSTFDQPKLRWRYRTSWFDNNAKTQSTRNREYQSNSDSDNHNSDNNQCDMEAKQFPMNRAYSATVLMPDPFDCIFGHSTTNEQSSHSDTSTVPPTVMNVNHKKSRRRRRLQRKHESQSKKT